MKVLYIGQYEPGSTSRMRGEYLKKILSPEFYDVVDISVPIQRTGKLFRSFGWRFYKGPLVNNINAYCESLLLKKSSYDLVWVDKGVFIKPSLLKKLGQPGTKLIHYTPDTAFTYNRSPLFISGLPYYKFCITTKSFEIEEYRAHGVKNILFCTQGYDPQVHRPAETVQQKHGIGFVGLFEPYRGKVVDSLLEAGILVKVAGANWKPFAAKHRHNPNFQYAGPFLAGNEYSAFYSGCLAGLGLLSKKFPELHTTRHFEIPACGTALVTERNAETNSFFTDEEALFFTDIKELTVQVTAAFQNKDRLLSIAKNGYEKVTRCGYDYESILRSLLKKTGLTA